MQQNNIHFLCLHQFLLLILSNLWVIFFGFVGQKIGYFWSLGQVQIVFWSTHIVQKLLFSLFPSILTFDFNLILWLFLTFWGPNWLFLGSMFKNCFGLHSCSWTTLVFYDSPNSDILIDLIFGSFLFVWGPNGLVWGSEQSWTNVLRSAHGVEQLSFSMFPLILRFEFDLI